MKKVINLFCVLTGLILLSSCTLFLDNKHDCQPRETTTEKFSDNDRTKIPYKTGTDTLTFMHYPSNIAHDFYGLGMLNGFSPVSYSRDIECPNDIANCEYQTYKYESQTISDAIYIAYYVPNRDKATHANFKFKTKIFDCVMGEFGATVNYNALEIQGKIFNNVYRLAGSEDVYDTTSYLLYSNSDGIIKIKFSNQDYWEIVK
ncbi:MAG: hypothetical protein WC760_06610 [Bacteroidia bacterium]|jgi:hypothetical protein